jgi:hypothetical protein
LDPLQQQTTNFVVRRAAAVGGLRLVCRWRQLY